MGDEPDFGSWVQQAGDPRHFLNEVLEALVGSGLLLEAPDQQGTGSTGPEKESHMGQIAFAGKNLQSVAHITILPRLHSHLT